MITRYAPFPFLSLGIMFIVIGALGQHTSIYVGIVFLIVALVIMLKMRKPRNRA